MGARIHPRWSWMFLAVLLALGLPGACQKDSPTRPSDDLKPRVAGLSVARPVLAPGDTTLLRAQVVRGPAPGEPVSGVAVSFGELLDGRSGIFSKLESVSTADGTASTVFRAASSDSGLVTVKAMVGESVEYAILLVTRRPSSELTLSAEVANAAGSLPADGRSTVEITVTAKRGSAGATVPGLSLVLTAGDQFTDDNGNGIHDDGEAVVPAGDRDADGVWDAQGTLPESAVTDAQGVARFTYKAGTDVGPVTIRITTPGAAREVMLLQRSLSLLVDVVPEVRELLADGVSETSLTLQVRDWAGTAVQGVLLCLVAGEPFIDTGGDGYFTPGADTWNDLNANGRWDTMGSISRSVVQTGTDGKATATYRAGLALGEVTIRATNTTTGSFAEKTLSLVAVPPAEGIAITLDAPSLFADGASTVNGTVTIRDPNGSGVSGKPVRLCAGDRFEDVDNDGRFTPGVDRLTGDSNGDGLWTAAGEIPAEVTTGADGRAGFTYRAGLVPQDVWIRAAADGRSQEARLALEILPPAQQLVVTAAFDHITVSGAGGIDHTAITAVCYDALQRTLPAGIPITFSIVSGPGGGERLEGAEGNTLVTQTNEQGAATATLVSGTLPGLVQVGVTSGSLLSTAGVSLEAGLAASLSCSADSVSLEEDSSCEVRAYVYDQAHNAVEDGTVVLFHADKGLVSTATGEGKASTVSGLAVAVFTAVRGSGETGMAAVTAETNGGTNGGIACTTYIGLTDPPGGITQLSVNAAPLEIAVWGTGADWQSRVRALALDGKNRPAGPGHSITFRISEGPGGGEHFGTGADSAVVVTDVTGTAEVVLESGTRSGTVVVSAWPTGSPTQARSAPIGIAAGPPVHVSVGTRDCKSLVCARVNVENPVVVLVSDLYRNPVRDGTAVHLTTSYGQVVGFDGLGTTSTYRGLATGTWRSDGSCGVCTVTASTAGGTLSATTAFNGVSDPYSAMVVPEPPDTLVLTADGGDTDREFHVDVRDFNGLPVFAPETDVTAVYGGIGSAAPTADNCDSSVDLFIYSTPMLEQDDSYSIPDDGVGAIDRVVVHPRGGSVDDEVLIRLRTGPASAAKSACDLAGPVPPGGMAIFSVTIRDRWGNPLGGHRLSLSAGAGTIDEAGITDAAGTVGGLTFTAPDVPGSVLVEIRDLDPTYGNIILRKTVTVSAP